MCANQRFRELKVLSVKALALAGWLALGGALLAACSVETGSSPFGSAPAPIATSKGLEGFAPLKLDTAKQASLRAASCPSPAAFVTPQSITLSLTPLAPDAFDGADLDGLIFAGGWHLESEEPNFGGLSGLAVHPKDHLLAISDSGAFVWISMADNAPSGFGAISYMRDQDGRVLDGKSAADAEGLALVDGLALVSFEREHRVLAFNLAECGAAANGILLANIPERPAGFGRAIPENQGAEALMIDREDHVIAGLEIKANKGAPLLQLGTQSAALSTYITRPSDKRLVGLDRSNKNIFALFRAYSPISGNANEIHAYRDGSTTPRILATLKRPFPVDNFEGITATRLPDGTTRLYIIADDNFSEKQRSLLLAFDMLE